MKYYEKGHTYHGVKMPYTGVFTDLEDKVITVIAAIIVFSPLVALLVGLIAFIVLLPFSLFTVIAAILALIISLIFLAGALTLSGIPDK